MYYGTLLHQIMIGLNCFHNNESLILIFSVDWTKGVLQYLFVFALPVDINETEHIYKMLTDDLNVLPPTIYFKPKQHIIFCMKLLNIKLIDAAD